MDQEPPSLFSRLLDRVFPKMPDFFGLLVEQSSNVANTVGLLVEYFESANDDIGMEIRKEEHVADQIKVRNIQILNQAFATPMDREDIYRSVMDLDEVVNYCKTTVYEMYVLDIRPDAHMVEMAKLLQQGAIHLADGFLKLGRDPKTASEDARLARKAERNVEKAYRAALADLFQGTDYISMFKKREVYRHISNAGDRIAHCAETLSDIIVKIA